MIQNRILVVEDSFQTASLIKDFLERNDYEVCAIAKNFYEAQQFFNVYHPSLLTCNIHLEGQKNGIEFVSEVKEHYPATQIVYISSDYKPDVLAKAQKTKPHAYLTKPFTKEQLIATIQMAFIQSSQNHPSNFGLTDKEIEVLKLLGQGRSNKEIGEQLFITHHAVDARRRKILRKLNVSSICKALCIASEKGWFPVEPVQRL